MYNTKTFGLINNHTIHGMNLGFSSKTIQETGRIDEYDITYQEEKTICEITDGPGVIQNIWLTITEQHVARAAQLRVYVDGEEAASIDVDMGNLGTALFLSGAWNSGWCQHMWSARSSDTSPTGLVFRYPIPYSTSVKITLYNPVNYTSAFSSQVLYENGVDIPIRLKSRCVPWITPITGGSEYTHINLTETEGWLVYNCLTMQGSGSNLMLESNMKIYIDGESTPSLESTGTEDWFDDCWYFGGRSPSISWRMANVINLAGYRFQVALDLQEMFGGLYFSNAVKTIWEATTPSTFAYIWLWYQTVRGPE